jgi:hypothetical protein
MKRENPERSEAKEGKTLPAQQEVLPSLTHSKSAR